LTFTASATSIKINRDNVMGNYQVEQPIAQLTLLGVASKPSSLKLNGQALDGLTMQYDATLKKLVIDGLDISLNESSELNWS
jgi:alpha-glucosidase